ncbi:MAG TPA: ABC transporter ATP-binding protein [bacterium]
MTTTAIRVAGLSKVYQISAERKARTNMLRDVLTDGLRNLVSRNGNRGGSQTVWALREATFEIGRGEIAGIIGQNGAGKSTLLKILSRITEPTSGEARIYGRVGSLLEVGTGFHPELTGRENVYLNGAVLGMTRREIDRKFGEIVAFSEIGRFLDTPVKRYSSGMHVRLAFAVAAHLEPDILLVDEVLAVGDAAFQRKSLGKMSGVAREGRTVLFVSHNMAAIQNLCTRAMVLRQGGIVFDGPTDGAIKEYLGFLDLTAPWAFQDNPERRGNGEIRFTGAIVADGEGRATQSLVAGQAATFSFPYENPRRLKRAAWGIDLFNQNGVLVADLGSQYVGFDADLSERGVLRCHVPSLPLPLGNYRIFVWIATDGGMADAIPNAAIFDVQSSVFYDSVRTPTVKDGACLIQYAWRHEPLAP